MLLQSYSHQLNLLQVLWPPIHPLSLTYRGQAPTKTSLWKHQPFLMVWVCSTYSRTCRWGLKSASAYLTYDYVTWYERSSIAHVQSPSHCLQLDLATSKGLHVPHDLILSSLPLISRAELANIVESCQSLMSVCLPMIVGSSLFSRVKVSR